MARVTKNDIECTIEEFVNSVYSDKEQSGWMTASFDEWTEATYKELVTWKRTEFGTMTNYIESNENRFDGKNNIVKRIRPILRKRLEELKAEGYQITAL